MGSPNSFHPQTSECMGTGDGRSPIKRWLYHPREEYRKLASGLPRAVVLKGKSIHFSGSIELSLFHGSKTPRWKIRVAFLPTWSSSAKAICTRILLLHGWPGLHLKFSICINFPNPLHIFSHLFIKFGWTLNDCHLICAFHGSSLFYLQAISQAGQVGQKES